MLQSLSDTTPFFWSWLLITLTAILILYTLLHLMRPLIRVGNYKATDSVNTDTKAPKVSVIVCTANYDEELMNYLDALTQQDYPDFEIIVVSDSGAERSEILAECCSRRYNNVHVTFIPPESHNLSRRKLALTLGMKAAKGEVAVTTISTAEIPSSQWLSSLMTPFRGAKSQKIRIALGYSHIDYSRMKGLGRWYKEFDSLMTDARWLGYAFAGKPYRGDGYNLAISRDLFFENKGYSRSLDLQGGDDDVFISEVATPENTEAVLMSDSILSVDWGASSSRIWSDRKAQYDFTSHRLSPEPFTQAGTFSVMQWIIPFLCLAAMYLPFISFISNEPLSAESICAFFVPIVLWSIFLQCEILIYRKAAKMMHATRLWWALPWFMLLRPIVNMIFRMRHHDSGTVNFI